MTYIFRLHHKSNGTQLGFDYFQLDKAEQSSCVPKMGRELPVKFTARNWNLFFFETRVVCGPGNTPHSTHTKLVYFILFISKLTTRGKKNHHPFAQ